MLGERLPKQVFYGERQKGKHSLCGQPKRMLQRHPKSLAELKDVNILTESWEQAAQYRKSAVASSEKEQLRIKQT